VHFAANLYVETIAFSAPMEMHCLTHEERLPVARKAIEPAVPFPVDNSIHTTPKQNGEAEENVISYC
jgi:hypothetical protein